METIIEKILDVKLDGKTVENYKPDDPEIFMIDKKDPVRAESLLSARYQPVLDTSMTIKNVINRVMPKLKVLLRLSLIAHEPSLHYWLFDQAVRQYAETNPQFYQEQLPFADAYFATHPNETSDVDESDAEYVKNRVAHYLQLLAIDMRELP